MVKILPLEKASQLSSSLAGGKAYNLCILLKAGFSVPSGFVVTPESIPDDILSYLDSGLWAVRSSAVGEDSGNRSFAGQHESFLNVPVNEVPSKITACRQSAKSDTARAYSHGNNADKMAVIVQQMIDPRAAGVAFTAEPSSGDKDQIWIELTSGMGDDLVGGTAPPQSLVIPRDKSKLNGFEIPDNLPIPDESIFTLHQLLLQIEDLFGSPQDIEWAYANGKFWILQSRPITTSLDGWTRANIGEVMPGVVTPLTWSVFRAHVTGQPEGDENALRLIQGRAYLNKTMLLRSFQWLIWADPKTISKALGLEESAQTHRHTPMEWGASILFLFELLGITKRLEKRVKHLQKQPCPSQDNDDPGIDDLLTLIAAWDQWTADAFRLHLYTTTYATGAYGLLLSQLGRHGFDKIQHLEIALLKQLASSKSAGIGLALRQLAAKARDLGITQFENVPENSDFRTHLDAFLAEYGDRAVEEFELHTPRWREDPSPVLALIRRYAKQPSLSTPISDNPIKNFPGLLSRMQSGYNRFVSLREALKHEVIRGYGTLRRLYITVGEHFSAKNILANSDDIFFLTKNEIQNLTSVQDISEIIRLRRIQWERHQQVKPSSGHQNPAGSPILKGIPCSPGVIEGSARVVMSFNAGLGVQPDEILVVPQADPAWTPLFLCAAGVVSEIGGYLSHSATVAREFGIPAVFNVPEAITLLKTGQRLRVDGSQGVVQVLD